MSTDGWVVVIPAPGQVAETARALLAIAPDPAEVRTQRGGTEFLVPADVAEQFNTPAPTRRRSRKKEGD